MSITVTVTNDAIKLPEGVHLPDGTIVRIQVVKPTNVPLTPPTKTFGERYRKYIGILKDGPTDLAENHDRARLESLIEKGPIQEDDPLYRLSEIAVPGKPMTDREMDAAIYGV